MVRGPILDYGLIKDHTAYLHLPDKALCLDPSYENEPACTTADLKAG